MALLSGSSRRAVPPLALLAPLLAVGLLVACPDARGAAPAVPRPPPEELARLDPLLGDAIRRASAAVADDPASPGAWVELAALYQANDLRALAEQAWEEALRRDGGNAFAWYGRALGAFADGRIADARAHAERAAELDPAYAPGLFRLGDWALADGDLDRARAWFERAVAADPAHPGGWVGLARIHLALGEHEAAATLIAARLLGGPCDGYGRQLHARALAALGRDEDARVLAAQGRGAEPAIPDPRWAAIAERATGRHVVMDRASALVRAGRPDLAVEALESLLGRPDADGDPALLANLGFALVMAGRPQEGLARARAAAALAPAAYRPLLVEGLALQRLGAGPGAVAALERAVELQPTAVDALLPLGIARHATGDVEGALEAFERGLALAPDHPELLQNAGLLQRRLGRHERAEATYRAWLALAPGHPLAAYGLGEARAGQGDHAEAAELFAGAADALERLHGPAHPDARAARERLEQCLAALAAEAR